jgi:pimeloyl-ACP methyl ester carboxylesterase
MQRFSATVQTEGADIAYDVEGQGPLLVLVAGGNGDSRRFAALSAQLSENYTVARYDRRANFRSTGDIHAELNMAQQGRDAAAVIHSLGTEKAFVFGHSAGANIALKLTQDHPQLIRALVVHEPPITDLLPEPEATTWRHFFDRVYSTYKADGGAEAMKLFNTAFVGLDLNASAPGDQGSAYARFLAREFNVISRFVPDLTLLRNNAVPMVTARGRTSADAFYALTARELARQLPCPCIEISGHHLGYATDPQLFANELHQILVTLSKEI